MTCEELRACLCGSGGDPCAHCCSALIGTTVCFHFRNVHREFVVSGGDGSIHASCDYDDKDEPDTLGGGECDATANVVPGEWQPNAGTTYTCTSIGCVPDPSGDPGCTLLGDCTGTVIANGAITAEIDCIAEGWRLSVLYSDGTFSATDTAIVPSGEVDCGAFLLDFGTLVLQDGTRHCLASLYLELDVFVTAGAC